ncbi:class II glutamine amidotransferase [bacterium]|nr:class II glutamine amidotransferase [candidate division CSSED10-310 bacterium]
MPTTMKNRRILLSAGFCLVGIFVILIIPFFVELRSPVTHSTDERDLRENCRLLGITSTIHPFGKDLFDVLTSFGQPSFPQNNGWSLSIYSDITRGGLLAVPGEPMIIRSQIPSTQDIDLFQNAAKLVAQLNPSILIGHLRNASSGCSGIADPHPFEMEFGNRHYLMIHNGGVWGKDLDYIVDHLISGRNQPRSCPETPIDSEYLFIYLMELIEKHNGDVWNALYEWATTLINTLDSDWNALNIVLTDGDMLWGVRISYRTDRFSLHYKVSGDSEFSAISTQALNPDWIPMKNYSLIELRSGYPAYLEDLPYPVIGDDRQPYTLKFPYTLSPVKQ